MNKQTPAQPRKQIENLVARLKRQGVSEECIQQLLREIADEYND